MNYCPSNISRKNCTLCIKNSRVNENKGELDAEEEEDVVDEPKEASAQTSHVRRK